MKTILFFLCIFSIFQVEAKQPIFGEANKKIFISNRVLDDVNGKAISVIDVVKRMDMQFYRQYPHYATNVEARYKFYTMYWRNALQELIDKELIMADAIESKMEVSNGDVRQEMETLFGPNILGNLDTAGLTFDEAWAMVKDDIIMKRMLGGKVNALAVRTVTPQAVKMAYEEYVKTGTKPDEMCYQVISIRGDDEKECAKIANTAHQLVTEGNLPLEKLLAEIPAIENVSVKVSEEFKHSSKEVSKDYIEALKVLEKGKYSLPIAQKSRTDQSTVYRIFYLKDIIVTTIPPLEQIESRLKDKLIEITIAAETEKYIAKLRKHYNVSAEQIHPRIGEDFQPFALR